MSHAEEENLDVCFTPHCHPVGGGGEGGVAAVELGVSHMGACLAALKAGIFATARYPAPLPVSCAGL
jgi:hypothetical protein